LNIFKTYSNL